MFTGLVEELATVKRILVSGHSAQIQLKAGRIIEDMKRGDSIAVNGVCLTVVDYDETGFAADAVPETVRRTNLGLLRQGDAVHVERALRVGDRLGGHMVSGHVDGTGRVVSVSPEQIAVVIRITAEPSVMRYIVEKGSVCLDGVSLTVMDADDASFRVSIIPHTGTHTAFPEYRPGRVVNIECDIIAKYLERLIGRSPSRAGSESPALSMDFLAQHGYL